jgi:hypothetical protein
MFYARAPSMRSTGSISPFHHCLPVPTHRQETEPFPAPDSDGSHRSPTKKQNDMSAQHGAPSASRGCEGGRTDGPPRIPHQRPLKLKSVMRQNTRPDNPADNKSPSYIRRSTDRPGALRSGDRRWRSLGHAIRGVGCLFDISLCVPSVAG